LFIFCSNFYSKFTKLLFIYFDQYFYTVGEHLKQYGKFLNDLNIEDLDESEKPIIEYEILDENGNKITLNNAEQLKQLASSVTETIQPDGSIIKEYILNDPKIIEKIRDTLKCESLKDVENMNSSENPNKIQKQKKYFYKIIKLK
jgi:hypothetical protein